MIRAIFRQSELRFAMPRTAFNPMKINEVCRRGLINIRSANRVQNQVSFQSHRPRIIKPLSQQRTTHSLSSARVEKQEKSQKGNGRSWFPLALAGAAVLGSDKIEERIKKLLEKDPNLRTIDERIELFNLILKAGEKQVSEALKKDIVVFIGNTDAGKSTLINFLNGCKMQTKGGQVLVSPDSLVKEMTPIGSSASSCTFLPQKVGGTDQLTFYDMPGFSDNRGVEVALANTIILKQLAQKAKSIRFVLVAEESELHSIKGQAWRETVKLLEARFNKTVGKDAKSVSVVITKNKDSLDGIKQRMEDLAVEDSTMDLSKFTKVYDPLDPNCRTSLISTIGALKSYNDFEGNVSMSASQITHAKQLGDKIADVISKDLSLGKLDAAKNKSLFTHFVASLGNEDLNSPLESAKKAIQEHAKKIIKDMDAETLPINRYLYFKNYTELRSKFSDIVDFRELDNNVRRTIHNTKDDRWASWEEESWTPLATIATLALGIGAYNNVPYCDKGVVGGLITSFFVGRREFLRTKKEKLQDDFFKGP